MSSAASSKRTAYKQRHFRGSSGSHQALSGSALGSKSRRDGTARARRRSLPLPQQRTPPYTGCRFRFRFASEHEPAADRGVRSSVETSLKKNCSALSNELFFESSALTTIPDAVRSQTRVPGTRVFNRAGDYNSERCVIVSSTTTRRSLDRNVGGA